MKIEVIFFLFTFGGFIEFSPFVRRDVDSNKEILNHSFSLLFYKIKLSGLQASLKLK